MATAAVAPVIQTGRLSEFLDRAHEFLNSPSEEGMMRAVSAAEAFEKGNASLYAGPSRLEHVEERLRAMMFGDEVSWGWFLFLVNTPEHMARFKPLSPFRDKVVIAVSPGNVSFAAHGELEAFLVSLLRSKEEGIQEGRYVIAFPQPDASRIAVFRVK